MLNNTKTKIGKSLLDELVSQKLIDKSTADSLKEESLKKDIPIKDLILERNLVKEEDLVKARSSALGIPYINLEGKTIARDVLKKIANQTAYKYNFVPFEADDKEVKIAMLDPEDFEALEALDFVSQNKGFDAEIYITNKASLDYVLNQYKALSSEIEEALKEATTELDTDKVLKEDLKTTEEVEKVLKEAPVSKAIAIILKHAVDGRASDIHIEPEEDEVKIRYRVDGVLKTSLELPKKVHSAFISRVKILSNLKIDETRVPQDGRFHSRISGREVDFRVSTLPTVNGEKVVLRILDKTEGVMSLEDLGLTGKRIEVVEESIKKPHGMFLVTGPTGSGKSTTLYSVIGILNKEGINIVTLEDPVEYFIEGVNQSQIKPEIGYSFASGLRSILRQDPDIIMVGEIRDSETAEMAVHSALTGHIVLNTLHTNNAAGAIPRLVDMGIEPFLIVSSVNIVVAQRLVRKLCDKCKKEYTATPDQAALIEKELANIPKDELSDIKISKPYKIYKAAGCDKCNNTGYKGRIGIFETISISSEIQKIILKGGSGLDIKKQARKEGMITMMEEGILKVLRGITSVEEILRVTQE